MPKKKDTTITMDKGRMTVPAAKESASHEIIKRLLELSENAHAALTMRSVNGKAVKVMWPSYLSRSLIHYLHSIAMAGIEQQEMSEIEYVYYGFMKITFDSPTNHIYIFHQNTWWYDNSVIKIDAP